MTALTREKLLPEPDVKRLVAGYHYDFVGNRSPFFAEYVMKSDYDALREVAEKLSSDNVRLHKLEHAIWHAFEDSEEVDDGQYLLDGPEKGIYKAMLKAADAGGEGE